jgi:hypothetical protein
MESLKSEIKLLIDKLADRYNHLPDGPVHPLDADLMLSLLRELYEKTEALRNQPPVEIVVHAEPAQYSQPTQNQSASPFEQPVEIPTPARAVIPPVITPPPAPVQPEIKPTEQQPFVKAQAPEIHSPVTNEYKPEHEFTRDSGIATNQPLQGPLDLFGTLTIADKLKNEAPSLKDKITSGKHDQSLSDRMQLKPISDLKAAVGLNDKFQFINELFEGSADRYNEAMNLLNSCSSASEADQLFADLNARYDWNAQNPVFKKLKEFVTRRYL